MKRKFSIKKSQVFIRNLEKSDYENWQQAHSCLAPAINEWDMSNWKDSELTRKKFSNHLKEQSQKRKNEEYFEFGIFRKSDGVLVGFVNLMDFSRGIFQNAYIGYRIFNRYWGQGYATQATRLAIEYGFRCLHLHRIEAGISPRNKASEKVAIKSGLKKEGLSKKRLFVNQKWQDLLIYAITCEDFKIKYRFKKL